MTHSTALHCALECIDAQREEVEERIVALETFADRVRDVPASHRVSARTHQPTPTAPVGSAVQAATTATDDGCVVVREAFVDTVVPHSVGPDGSLVETIASELTEDIAIALATNTGWTPTLKGAVLESVASRRREAERLLETLATERRTLEDAIDEIDDVIAWLRATAEESLLQCDFETLRAKHERLDRHVARLKTLTEDRQAQFTDAESGRKSDGTPSRALVASVYSSLPARYPLLSTATQLYEICTDCQRTVRAHLARRV